MKEFFVIVNGQQQGPFSIEQLAELAITPETEVWAEGMADWQQAGDVPELTSLLQQQQFQHHMEHATATPPPYLPKNDATTAPPAQTAAPATDQYSQWDKTPEQPAAQLRDTQPEPTRKKKGNGCGMKLLITLLILVIIGGVLAVTCPSRQDHKDAVSLSTRQWVDDKIGDLGEGNEFLSILTSAVEWVSGQGIDFVIDKYLDVQNYGVCSVGRINLGQKKKVVSVGVLNHVFTFDKEDVDKFLVNALKEKLGLDNTPALAPRHDEPTISEEPPIDEQDSYLATPEDEDSVIQEKRHSNPAEELLDSIAERTKRQAIKTAKEWAKKQIDKLGN